MRLGFFELLVNLGLGVAWVVTLGGALAGFSYFSSFGIVSAIFAAIMGSAGGLILVMLFETFNLLIDGHRERQKQTELLETLVQKLDDRLSD